ncbi:MAG: DUF481 domain-containing protein [Burkholderiales bacterium]
MPLSSLRLTAPRPRLVCPYRWLLLPPLLAVAAASQAQYQPIPIPVGPAPPPDGQWHGSVSAGGSASAGNNSARTLSINADGVRANEQGRLTLRGTLNEGSARIAGNTTTTASLLRLNARADHLFTERWFSFGQIDGERDKLQGLEGRGIVSAGLGYRLINNERTTWDVIGGTAYAQSRYVNDVVKAGAELTVGEESSHRLSPSTNFKQRLALFGGNSDTGGRGQLDTTLSTAIIGAWTMNLTYAYRYTSRVPLGASKADSLVTVGFGYKY